MELDYAQRSCDAIEERDAYDSGIAKKVAEFFSNFEKHFEQAPMSERKALVNQVVEKIVIDQRTRVAKCYLLNIPKQELSLLNEKRGVGIKTPLYNVSPIQGFEKVRYSCNLLKLVQIPLSTRVLRSNRIRIALNGDNSELYEVFDLN